MKEIIGESDGVYINGYRIDILVDLSMNSSSYGAIKILYTFNDRIHELELPPMKGFYSYGKLLQIAQDNAPKSIGELRKSRIDNII